jgi:two-component system response regulator AtoC
VIFRLEEPITSSTLWGTNRSPSRVSQRVREDLYYRLNAFTIQMPPLRARCDEIPRMLVHFVRQFASEYDCPTPTLSRETVDACVKYHWPGNIREMRGFVQRLVIQRDEEQALRELDLHVPAERIKNDGSEESVQSSHDNPKATGRDLKALGRERKHAAEKAVIARILRETHYNRKVTAQRLQISYKALFYKIHQYGLVWKAGVDERDDVSSVDSASTSG